MPERGLRNLYKRIAVRTMQLSPENDRPDQPRNSFERIAASIMQLPPESVHPRMKLAIAIGVTGLSLEAVMVGLYAAFK